MTGSRIFADLSEISSLLNHPWKVRRAHRSNRIYSGTILICNLWYCIDCKENCKKNCKESGGM